MQGNEFNKMNRMVCKLVHHKSINTHKARKWENKSKHNFAYISNISTY